LNKVLRDKGLEGEEELVLWEDELLEFIRCCATAVDRSISKFDGITINPTNTMAVASTDRFLIGYAHTYEQTIYRIPGIAVAALGIAVPTTARVFNSEHRKSCGSLPNPIAVRIDIIATASFFVANNDKFNELSYNSCQFLTHFTLWSLLQDRNFHIYTL
jgi:hypothetical protein